jgi:phosphoribosylamine--glycine ligase
LATITSEADNTAANAAVASIGSAWIGATDLEVEAASNVDGFKWLYSGATTAGFKNWNPGEPNNATEVLRALAGFMVHPNVGAVLAVDAGGEPITNARLRAFMAAHGYPAAPRTGDVITGLPAGSTELQVFHAGTAQRLGGDLLTAGGRVLAVTALGEDAAAARAKAYAALQQIEFAGMHYRRDIGLRA